MKRKRELSEGGASTQKLPKFAIFKLYLRNLVVPYLQYPQYSNRKTELANQIRQNDDENETKLRLTDSIIIIVKY